MGKSDALSATVHDISAPSDGVVLLGDSALDQVKAPLTAFTIHASKDGESTQTMRLGPTITVAKARELAKYGWQVHITDADGLRYGPEKFHELLRFDRKPPIKF